MSWTEKNARAKCRRKLKALKRKTVTLVEDISYEWGDVENSIVLSCDEMIKQIEGFSEKVNQRMDGIVEGEENS